MKVNLTMENKRKKQRRQQQVPGDLNWEMGKAVGALIREGKKIQKKEGGGKNKNRDI